MMPKRKCCYGKDAGSCQGRRKHYKVGGGGGGGRMHELRGTLRVSLESDLEHFVWEILLK